LVRILEHLVLTAHEAVLLTPSLLPVLKEAGVVDAGGQGLFVIFEGMLRYLRGEPAKEDAGLAAVVDLMATTSALGGEAGYGYDVQYLLVGEGFDVDTVRHRIAEMGESALVVGDPRTVKVHVHVEDPGLPLSYGASLGSLRDVVVEDMQAQYGDFIATQEMAGTGLRAAEREGPAVVVVALGDGMARIFTSLGASAIVHGGQTMNPSTKDLLDAVDGLNAEQVILLPNNKNVILAAEQAAALSDKEVALVPSQTIPQGVSALLALNLQASLEDNVAAMTGALDEVQTGEITTATRSVRMNSIEVSEGQIIGLHNGELCVAGHSVEDVAIQLLRHMQPEQSEIVTLYYGVDVDGDEATALGDRIQTDWPEQEVEVVAGGQDHYYYILSVE
jgi:DAK2 domain fusion protein YloV